MDGALFCASFSYVDRGILKGQILSKDLYQVSQGFIATQLIVNRTGQKVKSVKADEEFKMFTFIFGEKVSSDFRYNFVFYL
jgi:hypothetical protein